ncbi:MAG: fibronectin type III domain-containing protein, partial [Clostridiaceae bacterium]|nr:fibronectin type III domain-containing protein [Clostridiaceae bacterium]
MEDDTLVTVQASQGLVIPEQQNTSNGEFSFLFNAPTVVSDVYFVAKADNAEISVNMQLVADQPANIVFDSNEYKFEHGESKDIFLTITDIYENPVSNTKCMLSVTGDIDIPEEIITDSNGQAVINLSAGEDMDAESMILTAYTENGIVSTTTLLFEINQNPPDTPIVSSYKENGNIVLRWAPDKKADFYTVKRRLEGSQYKDHGEYITEPFFPDGDLISGNTYYYIVTATNKYGESAASSEIRVEYTMPMKDLGTLTADKVTVFANQSSSLIFRIAPQGRIADDAAISLVLTDENGNVKNNVTLLRDDGNVSNGDDIKADGVYSG